MSTVQINESASGTGRKGANLPVMPVKDHGDGTTTVIVEGGWGAYLRQGENVRVRNEDIHDRY
jgi:hypothetical protein